MASPFETVITRLQDIGAFQFLFPFMLTAAVFYGLIRKSHIFGKPEENVAVNAVVALVAAFMVWAYPILAGVDIETQLSTFFFNAAVSILTIVVGLMVAGLFFPPNLAEEIGKRLKGGKSLGAILVFGILIGGGILFSSGLITVFFPQTLFSGPTALPSDVILTVALLGVLAVILVAIIAPFGGGKGGS